MAHDLGCALRPGSCPHSTKEIHDCVICGGSLKGSPHLDTCSPGCFKRLMAKQRKLRFQADRQSRRFGE